MYSLQPDAIKDQRENAKSELEKQGQNVTVSNVDNVDP